MVESGFATGVASFEMGNAWSADGVGAWWELPEPLEAMVGVWGPVERCELFAVVLVAVGTI